MLILKSEYGGIAQLGERLNGIQEVSGSIPLISTIGNRKTRFDESQNEFLFPPCRLICPMNAIQPLPFYPGKSITIQ